MRLGLVGAGRIGVLHARTLRDLRVGPVVIADTDPRKAEQAAGELGCTPGTMEDIFGDGARGGVDGVVIAAATPAHSGLVRRAAAARIPVFCEKPLAAGLEETRELLAAVEQAGIPLQMGFQRRFDPGYRAARERLRSGELGVLHSLWACTMDPAPPPARYIPTSGGLFADCSVHDIDAIRWVTGREVTEVRATGGNRGAGFFAAAGDIATGHALLTLDDGSIAAIAAGRYNGGGYDVRLELHGSQRTAVAGLDGVLDRPYPGFAERFAEAYAAELAAFVEVAAGRSPSPCPGREALEASYVAEACERSRRENRTVTLSEVKR